MKLTRPDLAAYALVALCVVVLAVLTGLGRSAPDVVTYLAVTALGIGGGVALQGAPASSSSSSSPEPAPAPLPAPAAPAFFAAAPAPRVGATSDPAATGVFRAATHAP